MAGGTLEHSGQRLEVCRFGQDVIGTSGPETLYLAGENTRGERDDVASIALGQSADSTHGLHPIHHGHVDIHQNDRWHRSHATIDRFQAI